MKSVVRVRNGDDGPEFANRVDNSSQILVADSTVSNLLVDGFTVVSADHWGSPSGGGLSIAGASEAIVRNCTMGYALDSTFLNP